MSSNGGRSRPSSEQNAAPFPPKPRLRIVKDELSDDEQPFVGGAMSLAHEECSDDRKPAAEGPGIWLRRNREAHALTVEDLARTTKISKTILHAIENSDAGRLPAGIYTRGFVKAYAREVGLDPERTADDYVTQLELLPAHGPVDASQRVPMTGSAGRAMDDVVDEGRRVAEANQLRRFGWVTTGLALIGLVVYLVSFGDRDSGQNASGLAAEDASAADPVPASQIPPESAVPAPNAALASGGPLRVEITTRGLCWIVITVDGTQVLARLLQAGEHHTFEVEREALMRVGDPGALTFSINGQTGRPLGAPGEPVDVRITKSNFHQFLGT